MDARWERLDTLFSEALNLTPQERARLLARTPTEDPELARKLEELIRADAQASQFLDPPTREAVRGALEKVQELAVGAQIGPYRVVRTVGVGGMGSVYLARRDDGDYRQDVAIKLIKGGAESSEVVQRFLQGQVTTGELAGITPAGDEPVSGAVSEPDVGP